jgi:GDYXXLXY protein
MMRQVSLRIIAVAVLLLVGLTAMVLREEQLRQSGREVLLNLETVDPRDLLSGHYAALSLEEPLAPGAPCPSTQTAPGALGFLNRVKAPDGWVALSRKGDHYAPVGLAATEAAAKKLGEIPVRGSLYCVDGLLQTGPDTPPATQTMTVLNIGVSRFHADQAQAEHIAAGIPVAVPGKALPPPAYAIVSIGADGRARLKGLQVAGQRLTLSWF